MNVAQPPKKRAGQPTGRRRLDGEVMDIPALAAMIGGTEKCARARVARGLLPYRKWGGRVIFIKSEILSFLSKLEGVSVDQALTNVAARNGEKRPA